MKHRRPRQPQMPAAGRVEIEDRKVRGYLLSRSHPVGRFKARVFAALGFDEGTAEAFVEEVRRIAAEGELVAIEDTEFGRKYTVLGELDGPKGTAWVSTIWIQRRGQAHVRLVTVRPRWP